MKKKIQLRRSEDYYIKVLLKEVTLKEIMSVPVISIGIDQKFHDVATKFKQHQIRHLPVVGGDNKLVGLISLKDLFRIQPPHETDDGDWVYDDEVLDGIVLKHVMLRNPFFMYDDDCMGDAVVKIVEHRYGCIPVVNRGMQLQGIVTQEDFLAVAAQIFLEQ